MGNNIVKSVLVAVLLIVLSFSVGISAAEDFKGSALIILAICGLVALLCIGKNAWLLVFYVIFLLPYRPISIPGMPFMVFVYPVLVGVFLYCLTQRFYRNQKQQWRALPMLDVGVYASFFLLAYAFYRYPSMAGTVADFFDIRAENIGGKEYVMGLLACLAYLAASAIPISYPQLEKHVKPIIWLMFVFAVLQTCASLLSLGGGEEDVSVGEAIQGSRVTAFLLISQLFILYIFGTKSITEILTNFRYGAALMLAGIGLAVSGSRTNMAGAAVMAIVLLAVRGKMLALCLIGAVGLVGIYGASEMGLLRELPYGAQRVLSSLPGTKVGYMARINAEGSSEIRYKIWDYALDKRTGYIRDYVWGDGFAFNAVQMRRIHAYNAVKREYTESEQVRNFAITRSWHNGPIAMIHGLGIVGLLVHTWVIIWIAYYGIVVLKAYQNRPLFPLVVLTVPRMYALILFNYAVTDDFFNVYIHQYAYIILIKIFYVEGVRNGVIVPGVKKISYVPLSVQERQKEEVDVPEYPLPRKLKKLQNKQA